jgi:hypothetical protein
MFQSSDNQLNRNPFGGIGRVINVRLMVFAADKSADAYLL